MSKTPRTDVNEVEITGYAMSPRHYVRSEIARQLETELADKEKQLAEARAEIERLALEIENKQYTITCASEENQQLKESLAEARAEIERLKEYTTCTLVTVDSEMDDKDIAIIKRDKLIEQMREALKYALTEARSTECERLIKAALSAAERGE